MTKEEKEAIGRIKYNDISKPLACGDLTICNIEDLNIVLNLIQKQQEEIEKLKKVLDERFIYVTGARTVYGRLMSLDKETIVKDDLKLRNEIKQYIKEKSSTDKIIDEMIKELSGFNHLAICEDCEKICEDDYDYTDCNKCIKQYFERKVEM